MKPEKVSKSSVDYSPGMPKSHCGICAHYEARGQDRGPCERVEGEVQSSYWCKLFRRTGLINR